MTDTEILELAKNCEIDFSIKWRIKGGESSNQMYWECWEDQLLKFVRELCEKNDFYKTRCELLQKV
jgi:hypothetical protein